MSAAPDAGSIPAARSDAALPVALAGATARSDDAIETLTALLGDVPAARPPEDPRWHAARLCELAEAAVLASDPVPPVAAGESVAGGAATIEAQMREPFTAFAQGRLGISPLWPIVAGLSPMLRGTLIHAAAFHLYEGLPGQADIGAWGHAELDRRVGAATSRAFARHERHADRVLRELLALERERVSQLLRELVARDLLALGVELEIVAGRSVAIRGAGRGKSRTVQGSG